MDKPIDIRLHFAEFVRRYGGEVFDDSPQQANQPRNADYIFHKQKIITELKCLEKNQVDNPDVSRQIDACLDKWNIPRTAAVGEIQHLDLRTVPEECAREVLDIK